MADHCTRDIIIADTNVGSEEEPRMEVRVECNGYPDCGFSVEFLDEDGDSVTPGDWWVIGSEVRRYEELHRQFSRGDD